jgi:hypothetical protein
MGAAVHRAIGFDTMADNLAAGGVQFEWIAL